MILNSDYYKADAEKECAEQVTFLYCIFYIYLIPLFLVSFSQKYFSCEYYLIIYNLDFPDFSIFIEGFPIKAEYTFLEIIFIIFLNFDLLT